MGGPFPATRLNATQTLHCLSNQENASHIQRSHKNHTLSLFPIQDLPILLIMEEPKNAHSNSHVFLVILLSIMDTTQPLGHYPVDVGLNGQTTSLFSLSLLLSPSLHLLLLTCSFYLSYAQREKGMTHLFSIFINRVLPFKTCTAEQSLTLTTLSIITNTIIYHCLWAY